jgi:hypothetical protein
VWLTEVGVDYLMRVEAILEALEEASPEACEQRHPQS